MEHYFDPKVECASREQITAWQNERLVKQVERVYNNVPYYKKKMDELGVRPEHIHGIEDLHLLPTLSKDDLRDQYPYGLMALHERNDGKKSCSFLYAERCGPLGGVLRKSSRGSRSDEG